MFWLLRVSQSRTLASIQCFRFFIDSLNPSLFISYFQPLCRQLFPSLSIRLFLPSLPCQDFHNFHRFWVMSAIFLAARQFSALSTPQTVWLKDLRQALPVLEAAAHSFEKIQRIWQILKGLHLLDRSHTLQAAPPASVALKCFPASRRSVSLAPLCSGGSPSSCQCLFLSPKALSLLTLSSSLIFYNTKERNF